MRQTIQSYYDAFRIAFSMMTTLPFFALHEFKEDINGKSVIFYPLIGLIIGLILFASYTLLSSLFAHAHLMVLIFALYIAITGALHLDGFVDAIDGLLSYQSKEKALLIMKDPNIGAMGAVFLVVLLSLKLSSFIHLEEMWHLLLIPMLSRFTPLIAIYYFSYGTNKGMATLIKKTLQRDIL
jgi:adenosylcobinamide-GDP ribazoletransferase